jgi:hypothetical protein
MQEVKCMPRCTTRDFARRQTLAEEKDSRGLAHSHAPTSSQTRNYRADRTSFLSQAGRNKSLKCRVCDSCLLQPQQDAQGGACRG